MRNRTSVPNEVRNEDLQVQCRRGNPLTSHKTSGVILKTFRVRPLQRRGEGEL
jgi:hypothetical protein